MKLNVSPLTSPPKTIVNFHSAGGGAAIPITGDGYNYYRKTLSGALVANVYKELLAVTGAGVVDLVVGVAQDTTSRTLGLKIIIDGVTVFDAITAACTTHWGAIVGVGLPILFSGEGPTHSVIPVEIPFNGSLSLQVKSSLSETDKISLVSHYRTT